MRSEDAAVAGHHGLPTPRCACVLAQRPAPSRADLQKSIEAERVWLGLFGQDQNVSGTTNHNFTC